MNYEVIFLRVMIILFILGLLLIGKLFLKQTDKNMDLQKENTDLIERNLKLERQLNKQK